MQVYLYSFGSVLVVSLIALIGIITLAIREDLLKKILSFLVSFATGGLFGGAFLHLIPHLAEENNFRLQSSAIVLSGIIFFFILEKFIHWHHCHRYNCDDHPHSIGIMSLVGDGFHNLIDGLIIGGSYLIDIKLGITTTIAVILHEIPQEIGDFGILIHAGFNKKRALFLNFISALTSVIGVAAALYIGGQTEKFLDVLLPFAAGGFIYIAGSDLLPELKKDHGIKASIGQLLSILTGIGIMAVFVFFE